MSIFHSLLFIGFGLVCWAESYLSPSLFSGALWFVMGLGVNLIGVTSLFERLFDRMAKED
jgi:hypothetical protein